MFQEYLKNRLLKYSGSIYSSKIVKIGDQAHLFLEERIIVVFFGDNAPEELQDVAVVHELQEVVGEIEVGTKINLSNEELTVTAVGPVANENFVKLGTSCLKAWTQQLKQHYQVMLVVVL